MSWQSKEKSNYTSAYLYELLKIKYHKTKFLLGFQSTTNMKLSQLHC